ncbi:MAG: sensor histidine kinase [Chloroflexi bacterium]|nr:sensor histidine kinase [Chloroflexota bacterium]
MNESPQLQAGLLRIVRQAAWLRTGLILLGIVMYLAYDPGKSALVLLSAFFVERALFVVLVSWDTLREKLGASFLPIVIAWLLVTPVLEILTSIISVDATLRLIGIEADVLGVSSPLIWLVVPVIIAVWQYGRRGLQISIAALVVEHAAVGLVVLPGLQFFTFILNSGGRIAMLGILGYVVMLLVEAQKKDHAALEQANRQLAQRAATVEQLAESRERNRMARELHDILAHSITALSLQLQAIATLIDDEPGEAKALLRDAQKMTHDSANEVRRAIKSLRATQLEDLGLPQALRELCRTQAERTGAKLDCDVISILPLDPLTEQAVYRIAHEALANAERHASATQVAVKLGMAPARKLQLLIQDNGVGFDMRTIPPNHFGVIGMTERARDVGGALSVKSEIGRGTKVELEIPV